MRLSTVIGLILGIFFLSLSLIGYEVAKIKQQYHHEEK
jgi:cell shape-determining protein MreD